MSQIWHSAKILFLENTLSSAPVKSLGKEEFFKKKFKTLFAECHAPALGKVFFLFLASKFFV